MAKRVVIGALIGGLAAATVVGLRASGQIRVMAMVVAGGLYGVVLYLARRRWVVPPLFTMVALVVVLGVGLCGPPQRSRDVWAYATYGQMVRDGHDPYVERPAEVTPNAFTQRMAPGWKHARAVYGPGFLAIATVGMTVVAYAPISPQSRPVLARLWFQLMATLALLGALTILWRTTRDPVALFALGLSPVVTIAIVHEAHNDLLVGVALLAAVVLARKRPVMGVAVGSLAVLIKVSALLPLAGLVWWVLFHHGWKRAVKGAGGALLVIGAAYGAVGGQRVVQPILAADRLMSSSSIWSLHLLQSVHLAQLSVAGLAAAVLLARRRDRDGALAVAGSGLAYLLAAAYVLPWYSGWVLPAAVLGWRSRTTRLLLLFSTLSLITYGTGTTFDSPVLSEIHHQMIRQYLPWFEIAAIATLAVASVRRTLMQSR